MTNIVEMTSLDYIMDAFKKAEINASKKEAEKLSAYMDGVLSWNEKVNLTAITDPEEFVEKHYVDSLSALGVAEFKEAKKILDLGTGGGFPGIPLAIMAEDKDFTLLDSLAKRLKIIDALAEEIGIGNARTIHGRSEDLGQSEEYREKFDVVVSRAVAEMAVLGEYALPFVKVGGALIAYKTGGEKLDQEIEAAKKAIKTLGGELSRIKTGTGDHVLVIIKKIKKTPAKYPRKAGTPKKNPL